MNFISPLVLLYVDVMEFVMQPGIQLHTLPLVPCL